MEHTVSNVSAMIGQHLIWLADIAFRQDDKAACIRLVDAAYAMFSDAAQPPSGNQIAHVAA